MNIPPPMHTLAAAIDAAHEAQQEPPRARLGASQIGHSCDRYIWLSFRWAVRDCLASAYDEIKDRKGTMLPNGVFVKE